MVLPFITFDASAFAFSGMLALFRISTRTIMDGRGVYRLLSGIRIVESAFAHVEVEMDILHCAYLCMASYSLCFFDAHGHVMVVIF